MFETLEIKNLSKSFGSKVVLERVSFRFRPGIYGLLGPNGAGKTTFLRCILQHYKEGRGSVFYNGRPLAASGDWLARVAYLPQHFGAFGELSVEEYLRFLAALRGMKADGLDNRITDCLRRLRLEDSRGQRCARLSGGMLRRLGIAQTLLDDAEILIYDEATAGLDPEERLRFKELLRDLRGQRLILLSTHIVEDVAHCCDQLLIMGGRGIRCHGDTEALRRSIEGRVYLANADELEGLRGPWRKIRSEERGGATVYRVLAEEGQDLPAAEPTLEDFYMDQLEKD